MSCSDSWIEQNGASPPYLRIVPSWSRRPVRILCGYAWWPTSQRILSVGESSSECSATAISHAPRFAPKCPPISPTVSISSSRTSCATWTSSLLGQAVQVLGAVDAVEEGHEVRLAMKSVICSSSAAPLPAVARLSAARALRCDASAMACAPSSPYRVT